MFDQSFMSPSQPARSLPVTSGVKPAVSTTVGNPRSCRTHQITIVAVYVPPRSPGAAGLARVAAVGLPALGDEREQAIDFGLFVQHEKGPHDAVGCTQVGRAGVLGPAPFGPLAGLERRDDRVALVELQPHPQDGRAGPAGGIGLGRPLTPRAVGIAHLLEHFVPSRKIGRRAVDGFQARDRHPDFLEGLGVLAQVVARLLDHGGVGDLELGGRHQADAPW